MRNILLLAPPAAGKGTQAELLHNSYGIVPISTGDLLRSASQKEDAFGQKLQEILKSGKLVDDDIVLELLKEKFQTLSGNSFLLDGFPRNVNQARELDILLKEENSKIDYVFLLEVPKDILEKRITGRRICKTCGKIYNVYLEKEPSSKCSCGGMLYQRTDDTIDSFQVRYQTYLDVTLPLVEYYENCGILYKIDATQSIPEVFQSITSILNLGDVND